MASAEAAEKREHRRAAGERRRRRREAIVSTPLKMPSQEELLAEATVTEIANGESLRELLRLEEEKRRVVGPKKRIVGDVVSFRSRGGRSTVSVSKGVDVGEVMLGRG